jgi:light-regulated signal transduction histidine kinase (bacteriophytochrome)
LYEIEYRFKEAKTGKYRWFLGRAHPIRNDSGAITRWFGTCTDIDDQKHAEATLRQQAEELGYTAALLEERNRELDQFAYVTSHDLKAPLRGIANLSQWIEEDLGEHVTDDIRKQLELLRGRVHRMEGLIDGILQYSRIGRVQGAIEQVNVGELLDDVVDLLAPPPDFTITIAPNMPTLMTERVLLQQVFANLIGNAIKHHHRSEGQIQVDVEPNHTHFVFSVADDGPGIASQYQDRIFGMFQTLAPRDKVEGSGLGLSLVKKMVEHQGGRIWLHSEEGTGTTFFFTWPKNAQSQSGESDQSITAQKTIRDPRNTITRRSPGKVAERQEMKGAET